MSRTSALYSILAVLAVVPACHGKQAKNSSPPTPIHVRAVHEPSDLRGARYSGTIEPATRVDVAFKVSGYVGQLLQVPGQDGKLRKAQEGDVVSAGTVLAVVRQGDYVQKLAAANAQLAHALANAGQAKIDHNRTQRLLASNAVPVADGDLAKSRLAAAEALVRGAEAQASDAQILLGDTSVRSPISGVIVKRDIEAGTFVGPGAPAFSVADISRVKFVFGAPASLLPRLTQGAPVTVHVDTIDADLEGTVTRISPTGDPKSHVFDVETTIPNADGRLKPGFVASLGFAPETKNAPTIVLPLGGVVRSAHDSRGFAVYVVRNEEGTSVARLREVTLGAVIGSEVQVVSGLQKGDLIVSTGATLLVDGSHVRILPT
jgi:multidrug efflux system membrane fusion protein